MLLSGLHTVCDIFCKGCLNLVGWKYVSFFFKFKQYFFVYFNEKQKKQEFAHEESQKYKEGKFILEKEQLKKQYWSI